MATRKKLATAAEESALAALAAEHDRERVAWVAERQRLTRELEALQARVAELEAEVAQAAARSRELEAQLRALRP